MNNSYNMGTKEVKLKSKDINRLRSKAICAFLAKQTNIKRHPICEKIGFDSSNLSKCIKIPNRYIPEHHLSDFEKALKMYGFVPFKAD